MVAAGEVVPSLRAGGGGLIAGAPEKWAYRMGFRRVAGVDEAGRGALAGPLVAAAVIFPEEGDRALLELLADSKELSPSRREELFGPILEMAESWSFACVPPWVIDRGGLQEANASALREAVLGLDPPPDLVLVDYFRLPGLGIPQWSLVHADRLSRCVAAASILAKVIRDRLMLSWWVRYPEYGFENHKGYGTRQHLRALAAHGPTPGHRGSFRGVLQLEMGMGVEGELPWER